MSDRELEVESKALCAQYRIEHPESKDFSDYKIKYNLDRGWILGWMMHKRAALAQPSGEAQPVAWIERRYAGDEMVLEDVALEKMPAQQMESLGRHYKVEVVPLYAHPQPSDEQILAAAKQFIDDTIMHPDEFWTYDHHLIALGRAILAQSGK